MAIDVRLKRAYDPPQAGDRYRVLVDRLWPRAGGARQGAVTLVFSVGNHG